MKKLIVLLLVAVIAVGCGKKKEETAQYQGTTAQKTDFIAAGTKLLNEGKVVEAIKVFEVAIKKEPQRIENYLILSQIYMRLQNYPGAVDALTAATKVDPQNGEAYYLLAMCKAVTGDKEGAKESAQHSVDIFVKERNEEKFKQSVVLLQSLNAPADAAPTTPAVVETKTQ